MWIADNWKDYEVIDTSAGEKLERWSEYILVRPDPQVLWNTSQKDPRWKKPNGHYHRSSKGGGGMGIFQTATGMEYPLQWQKSSKPHISSETL